VDTVVGVGVILAGDALAEPHISGRVEVLRPRSGAGGKIVDGGELAQRSGRRVVVGRAGSQTGEVSYVGAPGPYANDDDPSARFLGSGGGCSRCPLPLTAEEPAEVNTVFAWVAVGHGQPTGLPVGFRVDGGAKLDHVYLGPLPDRSAARSIP